MSSNFEFAGIYLDARLWEQCGLTGHNYKCFIFRSPVDITGSGIDKTFAYIHAQMQNKFPFLWTSSGS